MKNKKNRLYDIIYPIINNKCVLDVGCVEHKAEREETNPFWVHKFLKDNCKEVIGIDYLKEEIDKLREKGYNVYCKNAETFRFSRKFDVIFAGAILEHLSNPGLFLRQAYKHLNKGGQLIITVPNTFYAVKLFKCLVTLNDAPPVNPEHTCWFCPTTIKELIEREGFKVKLIKMFDLDAPKKTLRAYLKNLFGRIVGKDICGTMLVIAKKKNGK